MIAVGKYEAKVVDYGMRFSHNGNLSMVIGFAFNQDGEEKRLAWFGSFKEGKARDITFKTLIVCGLKSDDIDSLAEGPTSGLLDTDKSVEIDIGVGFDSNGQQQTRIKWVNELGGGIWNDLASAQDVKSHTCGLKAEFASALRKQNITRNEDVIDKIPF